MHFSLFVLHLGDVQDVLFKRGHFAGELFLELAQEHRLVRLFRLGGGGEGVQGGLDRGEHPTIFPGERD